jgi:LPXTG-motif cell wall-anchored protein
VVSNYGTLLMTGGVLRQTNGSYALLNAGTATFDDVTIETSNGSGSVIWANNGTLTLNNCTTTNNFSGTMTGTLPSVILVSNSAAVILNGGSVTAPVGGALPAILVYKNATLTNNGAAISGGYVTKISDLSVSVSSGAGKVTLAQQTAEPGVTYYYKTTAADDTAAKPSYDTDFNSTGWTAFSTATDIGTASTATVYVQVVKVGDSAHRIYGWGQGSATPAAAPTPTPTPAPTPTARSSIYVNGRTTLTASVSGGTWSYDNAYLKLTDNGDGTATIKGLKAGTTTVTYTLDSVAETFTVTIKASELPATGQDFMEVWAFGAAAVAVLGYAYLMLRRKRSHA